MAPLRDFVWNVRQAICSLRGHDEFLQFEKTRLFLRCMSCGYETPGWAVDRKTSVVRFPGVRRSGNTPATPTRKIA
jgi:hypothetical protein